MALGGMTTRALLLGVSIVSMGALVSETALAQAAAQAGDVQPQKPKPAKKKRAAAKPAAVPAQVANANAQASRSGQSLDEITVTASKTQERAIDALAPGQRRDAGADPAAAAEPAEPALLYNVPGVWMQDRGDDPSTAINIRGLQDFGRVAVVVDGARQNYQRSGHIANGSFFLDPELIGGIDITRGPTANIYGSGAIGGVASFRTKDINDVLRPGETLGRGYERLLRLQQQPWSRLGVRRRACRPDGRCVRRCGLSAPRETTRMAPAPRSAIQATTSPRA